MRNGVRERPKPPSVWRLEGPPQSHGHRVVDPLHCVPMHYTAYQNHPLSKASSALAMGVLAARSRLRRVRVISFRVINTA